MRKIDRMPIPPHGPIPLDEQTRAAAERDAGVRRVHRATRWLVVGAVGLTGAIAGVAAQQTLPVSASASSDATASASASDAGYTDDGEYESDDGYEHDDGGSYSGAPQAPAQAPQSAPQAAAPSASSGAS